MRLVIVAGGKATRLRPHSWSKPKPLISVAGKPVINHIIDEFAGQELEEIIFITGPMGDLVEAHMREAYPQYRSYFIEQSEARGQSHAIGLAGDHLSGPLVVMFSDTLFQADFSTLQGEGDGVVMVKEVPDPSRFGIAIKGADGYVTRLLEKPQNPESNLAMIGVYYFKDGTWLRRAIEQQIAQNIQIKGEFYLVDAVNIMIAEGAKMRTQVVPVWEDTGTIPSLLHSNRYLLRRYYVARQPQLRGDSVIIPPSYVAADATITGSVIGPYASIGAGATVQNAIIYNSIVNAGASVQRALLSGSIIGEKATVRGNYAVLSLGDNAGSDVESSDEIDETFK